MLGQEFSEAKVHLGGSRFMSRAQIKKENSDYIKN